MNFKTILQRSVVLLSTVLVFGCSSGGSGGSDTVEPLEFDVFQDFGTSALIVQQPDLQWAACESESVAFLECATLVVPRDYSNPAGERINIAMARSRANPATQQRTLLLNPGGPGGGGIGFLGSLVRFADIPASLRSSHDFISFDPRGIGESTPVSCDSSILFAQDIYPTTSQELQQNLDIASVFATDCFNQEGEYLQQLGSLNVVRDMNEIRKALGIPEFDFLGYSYGTRLAALYLQEFPESSGRFVLDGSMTPDPSIIPLVQGSLPVSQGNIETLAQACIGVPVLCDPSEFLEQLQSRADEVGAGPNTNEAGLLFGILQLASTRPGFEQLLIGPLSGYVESGDIEQLEFLFRILGLGESQEGQTTFNIAAYVSVLCADDPDRPTLASLEALQASYNADSNLFAERTYNVTGVCAGWPESLDPIPQIATNQAPVSLVIGGPTDAQTPLIFAEQMAAAVGGQFLRSEHDGHTTVFSGRNRCTEIAAETFLSTGVLPTTSVCEAFGPINSDEPWMEPMTRPFL